MPDKDPKKSTDSWVYIAIYLFGLLGGIVGYLIAKDDKKMKFHAMQSILIGIIYVVCWFLFFLIVTPLIGFILWLYGVYVGYEEYTGKTIRIPYIAEYADKYV
jgi:uncharacterized membrane protein